MERFLPYAALLLPLVLPPARAAEPHHLVREQMGTVVKITVWHDEQGAAARGMEAAYAEIARVEVLLSEWREDSEISRVNREAGAGPVPVGLDSLRVLRRAISIGEASGGAFDVSWAALRGIWRFDATFPSLPDLGVLAAAVERIDYRRIVLDERRRTVRMGRGMALGLGGIAKGYAVDRAVAVLAGLGLRDVIVDAGGDVYVAGSKGGAPWRLGIRNPRGGPADLLAVLDGRDEALVTSGDYERYIVVGGKRYHHIIDPRTGQPARGAISVSVLAGNAMDADAMATAAFVLGPEKGLAFLEAQAGVDGIIVDSAGKIRMTSGAKKRVRLLTERVDVGQ